MKFSERFGYKPIKERIQENFMDVDLRNSIWNVLRGIYLNIDKIEAYPNEERKFFNLATRIWANLFKKPLDELGSYPTDIYRQIKKYFFKCRWDDVYDLIEFIAKNHLEESYNKKFMEICNAIFKRELSAYRFVETQLVKITSEEEIAEIEEALKIKGVFVPVNRHLKTAFELLFDRKNPEYKNSIKESISAVEAMCQLIIGDKNATLGKALKRIEKDGKIELHTALKVAFDKLFGYTSDAKGIRHGSGLLDKEGLDFEDAKFMFISCSAFINYLKEKINKAKIKIRPLE